MPQPPRVLLKSLGCRLNEAELESWAEGFRRRGFLIAEGDGPADLVVINTCAVTQEAARKSRQLLRRCQRTNPRARLAVSGCLAALEANDLVQRLGADLLIDNRDKDRLVEIAADALALPAMPALTQTDSAAPLFARGRQRAFVKVQDGCRYACTFCVTTLARGEERSRPLDEILEQVAGLAASGVREVLLTGVHLGGYGSDRGTDLARLVSALLDRTSMPRIRLGSLEPWDLPPDFWDLFADPRLMPHLHLPMQSGSDAVLRRMARRCKTAEFARLAERGRAAVPGLNLTTDIIVGFPGETEADFAETLRVAEASRFAAAFTFQYSIRPGTPAATMPGQVPKQVVQERYERLVELVGDLAWRENKSLVGTEVEVMFAAGEGRKDAATARVSGRARDNRLVHVSVPEGAERPRPGDLGVAEITYAAPHHLVADGGVRGLRRTRGGDAWDARNTPQKRLVGLGLPTRAAAAAG